MNFGKMKLQGDNPYHTPDYLINETQFPRDGKRSVCSPECYVLRKELFRKKHYKKKITAKKCVICKCKFETTTKRIYCSPECTHVGDTRYFRKYQRERKRLSESAETK